MTKLFFIFRIYFETVYVSNFLLTTSRSLSTIEIAGIFGILRLSFCSRGASILYPTLLDGGRLRLGFLNLSVNEQLANDDPRLTREVTFNIIRSSEDFF